MRRLTFQFLAQARNLGVDGSVMGGPVMALELFHDVIARQHTMGALHEDGQKIELCGS